MHNWSFLVDKFFYFPRYKNRLHEVQEKLKDAQLSEKTKDIEKYKAELKEIQQQVKINFNIDTCFSVRKR